MQGPGTICTSTRHWRSRVRTEGFGIIKYSMQKMGHSGTGADHLEPFLSFIRQFGTLGRGADLHDCQTLVFSVAVSHRRRMEPQESF